MKSLPILLIAGGLASALGLPAAAADADASVYDNNPECMNRDSTDNPKCVTPSDQTGQRRIFVGPNVPPSLKGATPSTPATGTAQSSGAPKNSTEASRKIGSQSR